MVDVMHMCSIYVIVHCLGADVISTLRWAAMTQVWPSVVSGFSLVFV